MLDDFVAPQANMHKEVIGNLIAPPNERELMCYVKRI